MDIIVMFAWAIVIVLFILIIYHYVIPYIIDKIILYSVTRKIKKLAKNNPKHKEIQDLAKTAKDTYKNY